MSCYLQILYAYDMVDKELPAVYTVSVVCTSLSSTIHCAEHPVLGRESILAVTGQRIDRILLRSIWNAMYHLFTYHVMRLWSRCRCKRHTRNNIYELWTMTSWLLKLVNYDKFNVKFLHLWWVDYSIIIDFWWVEFRVLYIAK